MALANVIKTSNLVKTLPILISIHQHALVIAIKTNNLVQKISNSTKILAVVLAIRHKKIVHMLVRKIHNPHNGFLIYQNVPAIHRCVIVVILLYHVQKYAHQIIKL